MARPVLLKCALFILIVAAIAFAEDDLECKDIGSVPIAEQCEFAKSHCAGEKLGFVDYFKLYYCISKEPVVRNVVAFPIILLILAFLFMSLGVVAGTYLCPNLSAVSRFLKIPDNISGMTLLAFGNDSPDIMSTYSSFRTDNASLSVGELIGAAFFVTCFVVGIVSVIKPFSLLPDPIDIEQDEPAGQESIRQYTILNAKLVFYRDIIFFIFTVLLLVLFMIKSTLTKPVFLFLVFLYIMYTATIVAWQIVSDRRRKDIEMDANIRNLYDDDTPMNFGSEALEFENEYTFNPAILNNVQFGSILKDLTKRRSHRFRLSTIANYSDETYEQRGEGYESDESDHADETESADETTPFQKFVSVVTRPVMLVMQYTVPLVTYDHYDLEYRFDFTELTSLLSSIVLSNFVFIHAFIETPTFFTHFWMLLFSGIVCAATYQNLILSGHQSNALKLLLSLIGMVSSISWIGIIASELISDLKFISVLTQLSEAILGLTIFAIGNSVGDLISDIVIAKLGYPLMALAACLGGPLLNILLGIGGSGLIVGKTINLSMNLSLYCTCFYILLNLIFMAFVIPANGYRFDKRTGIHMIGLWLVGTAINIIIELH